MNHILSKKLLLFQSIHDYHNAMFKDSKTETVWRLERDLEWIIEQQDVANVHLSPKLHEINLDYMII